MSRLPIRGSVYVDNFVTFGLESEPVRALTDAISAAAELLGLPCHPSSDPGEPQDFTGLTFDGPRGRVELSRKRLWRLRFGIGELLRRGKCSGEQLGRLVGHAIFACLIQRESFALLSSCYALIYTCGGYPHILWPSVRRELGWLSALLPLFFMDTWRTWSDQLHAGDASDFGFGVCSLASSSGIAAGLGRVSERWRFKTEDAIAARKHALRSTVFAVGRVDPVSCTPLDPIPAMPPPVSEFQMRAEFEEVPAELCQDPNWHVCFWGMGRPSQHSSGGGQGGRHVCPARLPKPFRPRQAPYHPV